MITNGIGANKFGIIRSVDANTDPALGDAGSIASGTVDFEINNTGAATFSSSVTTGGNLNVTVPNTPEVLLTHSNTSRTFLMAVDGSNAFFRANSTNNILFQVAGGTNVMALTNGGNVGIGTTSPTRLLEVSAVNPQMTLKSTTTTGFSELYFGDTGADNGYLSYAHNGDYLAFGVNNSERMRITSGGNVGIGTLNPTLASGGIGMTILGASYTQLRLESSASSSGIEFKPSTGNAWEVQANNTNQFFVYNRSTNQYTFLINASGNVNIGTATGDSGFKLDVQGSGRFSGVGFGSNGLQTSGANGGNGIYAVAGGSGGSGVYGFTNDLSSFGGTFEHTGAGQGIALRVIGWSTFSQAATFSSSVTSENLFRSNAGIYQIFQGGTFRGGLYNYAAASGSGTDYSPTLTSETSLYFTTGGSVTRQMTITSSGNVLIGTTTTPTPVSGVAFPLTVSSSAATRIRIDSTQATPNSGVGLYANGVQKFSFAMYGTDSDFTIYNDALLASALLVKGTNSNVLIGTTTDVGAKLYVDGAFRTGTLTAGTQTAAVDWRLGNARGGAATNNALIRVQINGVLVDLLGNYV
jgi:hypothetical protein